MDLDGLIPLLLCILLSYIIAVGFGVLINNHREDERRTILGFSNASSGIGILFCICLGLSFYFAHKLLAPLSLNVFFFIIFAIISSALVVLFVSLGLYKGKEEKDGTFIKMFSFLGLVVGVIVTFPAKLLFKAFKLDASDDVTEEDVLNLVDTLLDEEDTQSVDENQKEMISGVFELDDVCAVDIMTHRTDVIAVDENTPASEVVKLANAEGISRLPVFNGRLDNVTGIIYIKDLLTIFCDPETAEKPIRDFMRNAMFVPESCHARELLVEFKTKHTQIAVVVDEYGGTSGIVTMEDVLEEIVGNIQDEFDNEEEPLVAFEGGYICDASIDLEDIFKAFNLEPPACGEDEDFDTVSGLITQTLGKIPTDNEQATVHYGGISFLVCEADPKRILKVKCTLDEVTQ